MARTVLLFVLVSSILLVGCSQGSTVEGVVDHKMVEGVKGSTQCSLLLSRTGVDGTPENSVYDDGFQACFPVRGELVVSEGVENQMKAVYSDFVYHVMVRKSPGDNLDCYASREIFNRMRLGATVKFQVSESSGVPRIVRIIG